MSESRFETTSVEISEHKCPVSVIIIVKCYSSVIIQTHTNSINLQFFLCKYIYSQIPEIILNINSMIKATITL